MSLFPVKIVEKEVVRKTLKDLTDTQIKSALDLLQAGASHTDVKYALHIPTFLVREIEQHARRVVSAVLKDIDKAKSVDDLKAISVDVKRKDLIVDKMVALSLPNGEGTLTTLKEAVGIIELEPVEGDLKKS